MNRNRKIALLVIVVIVATVIALVAFAALDVIGSMATGSERLDPSGASVGDALVVYNPGFTGQARQAAGEMAQYLRQGGYTVTLAGVSSAAASDTSRYSIVIVGGPVYGGTVSATVGDFIRGLDLSEQVRLGVFGTTGTGQSDQGGLGIFQGNVEALLAGRSLDHEPVIGLILTVDVEQDCAEFVDALRA